MFVLMRRVGEEIEIDRDIASLFWRREATLFDWESLHRNPCVCLPRNL